MKPLLQSLLVLPVVTLGLFAHSALAGDHDGHDHSGHDHSHDEQKSEDANAESDRFAISKSLRDEIGLKTQAVEMRELSGTDEAVIAILQSSVFEQDGKSYVFAQMEDNAEKFERWEVSLGASEEPYVEAKTGVFPGDTLVSEKTVIVAQIEDGTFSQNTTNDQPSKADPPTDKKGKEVGTEQPTETKSENSCPLRTECEFTQTRRGDFACDREPRVHHGYHQHPPACETAPRQHRGYGHGYPRHPHGSHGHHNHHDHQHGHSHHRGW